MIEIINDPTNEFLKPQWKTLIKNNLPILEDISILYHSPYLMKKLSSKI